jgi:ATP-dependent helicase/nuclease subunit B
MAYAKCSLSGVPEALSDEFELYVEKWRIDGERFTDGVIWNMNPDGYTAKRKKGTDDKLLLIDKARCAIINPLIEFEQGLKECDTVEDLCGVLLNFLVSLDIENKLDERAEARRRDADENGADELRSLWKNICDALDTLYDTLGKLKVKPDAFLNLLKIVFENTEFGRIPSYTEAVTIGSADMIRLYNKKHVYVIGAVFGKFPAAVSDKSYFSDKDRLTLNSAGLEIEPVREKESAKELYYFLRALSFASEAVTVTYPSESVSFTKESPSDAVKRISEITDGKITAYKLSAILLAERTYTADFALEHLGDLKKNGAVEVALKKAGYGAKLCVSERPIRNESMFLSSDSLGLIYGKTIALTQSRIDKFVGCPMSYFCQYNLSLGIEKRAEFDAANIGTFIHAVLESFFKTLKRNKTNIGNLSDEEKNAIIESSARAYVESCFDGVKKTARNEVTVMRLCRSARPIIDGLCDEFSSCEFEPTFFELNIGADGGPEAATFTTEDGRKIAIYGAIDRVDTYRHGEDTYVRVVDYKTGSKVFSPDDIAEGKNLQMFLYLKSITDSKSEDFKKSLGTENGGRVIPAGVIYVKTDIGDSKISKPDTTLAAEAALEKQKRLGMLLDDEISIGAMNKNYLPISFDKKTGEPDKKSKNRLYSEDGWSKISETVEKTVTEITKDILGGEVSALPLRHGGGEACTYCDFKAFCRNAKI